MFSLTIFLYAYLFFLLVWFLVSLASLYHLIKFGSKNFVTFFSSVSYVLLSAVILSISFFYILQIDWSKKVIGFDRNIGGQIWYNEN